MTREYFLYVLMNELKAMPPEEKNDVYRYYVEYFEDRGVTAGCDVPPDMDTPQNIAAAILQGQGYETAAAGAAAETSGTRPGNSGAEGFGGQPHASAAGAPNGAQTAGDNDFAAQTIPADSFDRLDVQFNLGGLTIETADIPAPLLRGPKNNVGKLIDYKLEWSLQDRVLIIRDRFKKDWTGKSKRLQMDPAVLLLPRSLKLAEAKLDINVGNSKMIGLNCERLELHSAMGSLKLENSVVAFLEADISMGSVNLSNTRIGGSKLSVQMGSLKGSGVMLGRHDIACALGSVTLKLDQARRDTQVFADVTVGSFKIDGEAAGPMTATGRPAAAELYLDVSAGSVTINFQ